LYFPDVGLSIKKQNTGEVILQIVIIVPNITLQDSMPKQNPS
jgi:hypothetical protein